MQEDDDGNLRVISYASHMLKPYERSMREIQLRQIGVASS